MSQSFTQPDLIDKPARQLGVVSVTGSVATTVGDGSDIALGKLSDGDNEPSLMGRVALVNTLLAGGLPAALGAGGGLKIDGSGTALPVSGTFWQVTQPISAATLETLATAIRDRLPSALVSGRLAVDGSGVTQPVSGTFWQATQPVSAASLPLPTGAATETTVATLAQEGTAITGATIPTGGAHVIGWLSAIWKLLNGGLPAALGAGGGLKIDGSGTPIPVSGTLGLSGSVDTELPAAAALADATANPTAPAVGANLLGYNGSTWDRLRATIANGLAVDVTRLPALPTGANTIGTVNLGTLNGAATAAKQPALGTAGTASADVISVQGVAGGVEVPVTLAGVARDVTVAGTNTRLGATSDSAWTSGSGTVIAILKAIVGAIPALVSGRLPVDPSGVTSPVSGTFWQATQPTSNAATTQADGHSATIGATADADTALTVIGLLKKIKALLTGTLAVSGTFWQATQPVSAASLPLPTGAATETTVAAINTATGAQADSAWASGSGSIIALLKAIAGKFPTLVSGRFPVDGSGVTQPVSGTFWQATQPVSLASVPSHAVTNAGTFAVQDSQKVADNAAFTDGTTPVAPNGFIFDEVAGTALTENDIGAARMDSKRAQVLTLEDATTRGQRAAVSAGGALKVDGSAATQPVSGTVTANLGTPLADGLATGSLTALNQAVTVSSLADAATVAVQVTGTWVGSVSFEGTVDGTNWVAINAIDAIGATFKPSVAANGIWILAAGPMTAVRAKCSAYTSGTIVVTVRVGHSTSAVMLTQSLPNGVNLLGIVQTNAIAPPNLATSQTALSTSAASVAVARSTRQQVTVRNLDAAISIYVGASGVTTSTGMLLKAGESLDIFTTGVVYAVAASGTPTAAVIDQYY